MKKSERKKYHTAIGNKVIKALCVGRVGGSAYYQTALGKFTVDKIGEMVMDIVVLELGG